MNYEEINMGSYNLHIINTNKWMFFIEKRYNGNNLQKNGFVLLF